MGGATTVLGSPAEAKLLAASLDVLPTREEGEDGPDRAHVHGFHSYPARLHPVTAERLVNAFSEVRQIVIDPFCGSGTVLVEAMLAGRRARGADLNPLAVRLARCKTRLRRDEELTSIVESAATVRAAADARRKARAGATRRFPPEDVQLFDPHVLLELDSLRHAIDELPEATTRLDLELVLSAILVKVSRKTADTVEGVAPRRLAAGYTAKLFFRKAEELGRRLEAFRALLPPEAVPARIEVDDATSLDRVRGPADLVVSSPPYVATYDYASHHALRLRWLRIDARSFDQGELGAKRAYARLDAPKAADAWNREVEAFLAAIVRRLAPRGRIALVMADSALGAHALRADEVLRAASAHVGLRWIAQASQERPHFHAGTRGTFRAKPRAEHVVLLERR